MPAVYAHYVFGRNVYRQLPEEVRRTVHAHRKHFVTGFQGPDILFFYKFYEKNAVNQTGYRMHEELVSGLIDRVRAGMKEAGIGRDSAQGAYLLGFLCHFMLDSACHPYVNQMMEELSLRHVYIETEFEKFMLEREGHDPDTYPVHQILERNAVPGEDLTLFYEGVTGPQITSAIRQMALIKRTLTPGTARKQAAIRALMQKAGVYETHAEQVMWSGADPKCAVSNEGLLARLEAAVPEAAEMVTWLWEHMEDDEPVPERLRRDFE